ncbi:hypothetical protein FEM41_14695 [Jejubacter calystegiae]|uniref:Uncharacterized protein n=1 Tax=Jejubacter calystegiae TaxID=2579935 RepID=A0A4P8YLB7_9ENTR|nr:hypothetical protein FEM41_14695 [Jejubacter calystegiae]
MIRILPGFLSRLDDFPLQDGLDKCPESGALVARKTTPVDPGSYQVSELPALSTAVTAGSRPLTVGKDRQPSGVKKPAEAGSFTPPGTNPARLVRGPTRTRGKTNNPKGYRSALSIRNQETLWKRYRSPLRYISTSITANLLPKSIWLRPVTCHVD